MRQSRITALRRSASAPPVSFKRHRFPPDVIRLAVWLHLDEMVVQIRGERMWLWRAVDDESEVLDMLVQKRCDTGAALRLLRKLLRRNGIHPESFVTAKISRDTHHRLQ